MGIVNYLNNIFGLPNFVAVLQFFEHGSSEQRKELADQLVGNMLNFSLQMYGCRVIQKVCGTFYEDYAA